MYYHYILDEEGNPVPEHDTIKWGKWYQTAERHVGDTDFGDTIRVSTVFLSIPHVAMHSDAPMLYETMVFANDAIISRLLELSEHDDRSIISQALGGVDIQKRYATRDEALQGHAQMCNFIEVCITNGWISVSMPDKEQP
jgi:hypothetical protein